jgi:replicative DNA helicase
MTTNTISSVSTSPVSGAELLAESAGERPSGFERRHRFATGMQPLDDVLAGGFQPHDLVTITGKPGAGKTIMALQWARWLAKHDVNAIYVCYEHSPRSLLARLGALEVASKRSDLGPSTIDALARAAHDFLAGAAPENGGDDGLCAEALRAIDSYARRLTFVQGSRRIDMDAIDRVVGQRDHEPAVVFVDYLQKVPVPGDFRNENERTAYIVESMKEIAITRNVGVVAIVAAERDALAARRLRLHNMRGSSALAYESDLALVMNDKALAVSKSHLAFDPVRAETFKRQILVSIEKNRSGPSGLDMEFTRDFAHYRIDPQGAFVVDNLVDEVLYTE